jgi:uncharacterized RDD family membrane protein YckC
VQSLSTEHFEGIRVSDTKERTYYELLGVSFYASEDELRRGCENALRRLEHFGLGAKSDAAKIAENAERRKQIIQAYAMLKDPPRRAKYNASIMAKLARPDEAAVAPSATVSHASEFVQVSTNAAPNPSAAPTMSSFSAHTTSRADMRGAAPASASAAAAVAASTNAAATAPSSGAASSFAKPEVIDLRASMRERIAEGTALGDSRDGSYRDAEYAHLGVRFVAMMIDGAIIMALSFLFIVIKQVFGGSKNPLQDAASGATMLGLLAVASTYYIRCESGKYKSTWGKRWMGLEVTRADSDEAVGKFRAFFRYLLRQVSSSFMLLGYLMAFFTERKQALHDMVTDSVVMSVRPPPSYWILMGIGFTVAVTFSISAITMRVAKSTMQPTLTMARELSKGDQIDRNRPTPTQSEVQLAYASGVSLQNALRDHYASQRNWPQPAETDQIVAQTSRPETLRAHEAKIWPEGMFSISLGATASGTARMLFFPDSDSAKAEWTCVPIHIAEEMQIEQCGGE